MQGEILRNLHPKKASRSALKISGLVGKEPPGKHFPMDIHRNRNAEAATRQSLRLRVINIKVEEPSEETPKHPERFQQPTNPSRDSIPEPQQA